MGSNKTSRNELRVASTWMNIVLTFVPEYLEINKTKRPCRNFSFQNLLSVAYFIYRTTKEMPHYEVPRLLLLGFEVFISLTRLNWTNINQHMLYWDGSQDKFISHFTWTSYNKILVSPNISIHQKCLTSNFNLTNVFLYLTKNNNALL